MKIHTIKFDHRPEADTIAKTKAGGYRFDQTQKVWYKIGEDQDQGVDCYRLPRLTLSSIDKHSDVEATKAADARIKAEWRAQIDRITQIIGRDSAVYYICLVSSIFVSSEEFLGSTKARKINMLIRG